MFRKLLRCALIPIVLLIPLAFSASLATHIRVCAVTGTVKTHLAHGKSVCNLQRNGKTTECKIFGAGVVIETGADGYADIEFRGHYHVRLSPNTKVRIRANIIWVKNGKCWFRVDRVKGGLIIKTPTAIAGIRGTQFLTEVGPDGFTRIRLIKGKVVVTDVGGKHPVTVTTGQTAQIKKGKSPTLVEGVFSRNEGWWTDWPKLVPIAKKGDGDGGNPASSGKSKPAENKKGRIILSPSADSWVYAYSYRNWNRCNWGANGTMSAGWNPTGGEKRVYMKFMLPPIKSRNVKKAVLKLYNYSMSGSTAHGLEIHRVKTGWKEGTDKYHSGRVEKNAGGSISWDHQPVFDPKAAVSFNPGAGMNRWVKVDVTNLVKAWLNGTPNNGLVITAPGKPARGTPESTFNFCSREYKDASRRPVLKIVLNSGKRGNDR